MFDSEGKIVPSRAALDMVEREHPDAVDAEKWRLAQVREIFLAFEKANGHPATTTAELEEWFVQVKPPPA